MKEISQFTKLEHAVNSVTSLLHNPSPVIPSVSSNRSQEMPHSNGWYVCQPATLVCGSFLTWPCSCPPKGYRHSFIFSTALRNWFYLRLPWFLQIKKLKVKSLSRVWLFATAWTGAHQASLSVVFSRQEYWSGLPFPSPEDLPDSGIQHGSPAL